MAARSGPSPFNDYDAYQKFKRATKAYTAANWSVRGGWRKMPTKPNMRTLTSTSGSKISVPEDDYQEFMTFFKPAEGAKMTDAYQRNKRAKNIVSPADYVDYAFGKNTKAPVYEQDGVGHISKLWYTRRYQILKVQFASNGSIVAFFRVPAQLAATLMSLAQSGVTRHTQYGVRHLLGIYFWDLVRIRGTVHGSRYKYEYVEDNSSGGLPGRPYGSGDNFYWSETTHSAPVRRAIDALQQYADVTKALHHLVGNAKDIQKEVGEEETKKYYDALAGDLTNLEEVKERIAELKNMAKDTYVTKVEPRVRPEDLNREADTELATKVLESWEDKTAVPRNYFDKLAVQQYGALYEPERQSAMAPISKEQLYEIANQEKIAEAQKKEIRRHNFARRAATAWDVDRIDSLVDNLETNGALGTSADTFYNKFPHASQQFDYLKARGFIPPNAKFV